MHRTLFLAHLCLSLILMTAWPADAQVSTAWTARYSGPGSGQELGRAMKADSAGNVFVAVQSGGPQDPDFVALKYGPSGTVVWSARYGSTNLAEFPNDIALDSAGNVFVSGSIIDEQGDTDIITIKYNSSGVEQWARRFQSGSNDYPSALAVDSAGNVYVGGTQVLLKYNTGGILLWSRSHSTPDDIAIDGSGHVYVTGTGYLGSAYFTDTLKYDAGGTLLWSARQHDTFQAEAVAADAAGNVYVGTSAATLQGADFLVLKYSAAGTLLWSRTYQGLASSPDILRDLTVDGAGDVYVVGTSTGAAHNDIVTVKFANDGARQWVARYNSPANSSDEPVGIAVDSTGNVYAGGQSVGLGSQQDFVAIKYDANVYTIVR